MYAVHDDAVSCREELADRSGDRVGHDPQGVLAEREPARLVAVGDLAVSEFHLDPGDGPALPCEVQRPDVEPGPDRRFGGLRRLDRGRCLHDLGLLPKRGASVRGNGHHPVGLHLGARLARKVDEVVERGVVVHVLALFGPLAPKHAERGGHRFRNLGIGRRAQLFVERRGKLPGLVPVSERHYDELVARIAAEHVHVLIHFGFQDGRHVLQDRVADDMAVLLVEVAELVEVHEDHRDLGAALERRDAPVAHGIGPRQAGERVERLAQFRKKPARGHHSEQAPVLHHEQVACAGLGHQVGRVRDTQLGGNGYELAVHHVFDRDVVVLAEQIQIVHHADYAVRVEDRQTAHVVVLHEEYGGLDLVGGAEDDGVAGHDVADSAHCSRDYLSCGDTGLLAVVYHAAEELCTRTNTCLRRDAGYIHREKKARWSTCSVGRRSAGVAAFRRFTALSVEVER